MKGCVVGFPTGLPRVRRLKERPESTIRSKGFCSKVTPSRATSTTRAYSWRLPGSVVPKSSPRFRKRCGSPSPNHRLSASSSCPPPHVPVSPPLVVHDLLLGNPRQLSWSLRAEADRIMPIGRTACGRPSSSRTSSFLVDKAGLSIKRPFFVPNPRRIRAAAKTLKDRELSAAACASWALHETGF